MPKPEFLITAQGRKIAYHKTDGEGPGVVFLGGFASDMSGSKATYLEAWAREKGRAFIRFDYSGHGESSEKFVDGCIGEWADDAYEVISHLTDGPQVLVGSSMGGWISLLMAKRMPARIAGLVGIAAAPDFTEDSMGDWMDDIKRAKLAREGVVFIPSDYGDPYPITNKLIKDGRKQLVLREPLNLPFPVR
jgi:pimeloyl-ACP methyl ester carboxylesterase